MHPLLPAILLSLCPLQQTDPPDAEKDFTLSVRAEKTGTIHCSGTAAVPDRSRLTIYVCRRRAKPGRHLAKRVVIIKDGKFSVDIPVFDGPFVPGPYVVLASYHPSLQRVTGWDEPRKMEARVVVEGDVRIARVLYVQKVARAIQEMDKIRREMPADWRKRARAIEEKFGRRLENRIYGMGDLAHYGFGPMTGCIGKMSATKDPEEQKRLNKWFDSYVVAFTERLGPTSKTYERARELLKLMEAAIGEGRPVDAELLELSPLISRAAHATLLELATASRGDDPDVSLRCIKKLATFLPTKIPSSLTPPK